MTMIFVLAQAAATGMNINSLIPMGLIAVVFYFFMVRPQMKKVKDHKKLVEQLQKNDRVVTTAGIHGRIIDLNETTVLLEMEGGTKIRFDKSAISLEATNALKAKATAK